MIEYVTAPRSALCLSLGPNTAGRFGSRLATSTPVHRSTLRRALVSARRTPDGTQPCAWSAAATFSAAPSVDTGSASRRAAPAPRPARACARPLRPALSAAYPPSWTDT